MSAVPAWKRLGLKLKGPSDGSHVSAPPQPTATPSSAPPAAGRFGRAYQQSNPNGHGHGANGHGTPAFSKRKQFPAGSGSYPTPDNKRPRRDDSDFTPSRKAVSFSQDTKKAAPKKPKTKKPPKPQAPPQPFDFTPVLEYLRAWHNARDTWKFNKNHQTLLIKYLYKSDAIPAPDIAAFYSYVQDIKGASRKRLVEEAKDIRKKDMDAGPKGFPDGVKAPEEKQKQYEEMLADLLKRKAEIKEGGTAVGNGKRGFDEVEFVLRTVDRDIQQRVVKRMRAETIIDELESSDSGESTAVSTSTSTSTQVNSSRVMVPVANGDAKATNGKEGAKLKAKRRKKLRTADVDSSSESDSESESESDSSDSVSSAAGEAIGGLEGNHSPSSSSSESDSDEDMDNVNGVEAVESSSSSSSSSEDGSGSESEGSEAGDVVTKDDDAGSDGDSESSDSDDEDA